jgi:hypothetical protein
MTQLSVQPARDLAEQQNCEVTVLWVDETKT